MAKEKANYTYIAIVAIVAIVALVVMTNGIGNKVVKVNDNLKGAAITKQSTQGKFLDKNGEFDLNLMSATEAKKYEVFALSEINNFMRENKDIDYTKFAVVRESTEGILRPSRVSLIPITSFKLSNNGNGSLMGPLKKCEYANSGGHHYHGLGNELIKQID